MASSSSDTLQDYVKRLLEVTSKAEKYLSKRSHETVNIVKVEEFSRTAINIHNRLLEFHNPAEGSMKIVRPFFSKWNNIMLGVYYVHDMARKNKKLTRRQYDILLATIEEIGSYSRK